MSYSARNMSPKRQIDEGLTDREAELSAATPPIESRVADEKRNVYIQSIVMGINPEYGTHMSAPEWASMLDAIQATPDQRRLYEETQYNQLAAENSTSLTMSDLLGEDDDLDRYPEGDYNPGHP